MAENKFLDDIAKFGNSTLSAMSSMQRQVRKWASEQVDTMIDAADLVTKQELDRYKVQIDELENYLRLSKKAPRQLRQSLNLQKNQNHPANENSPRRLRQNGRCHDGGLA